MTREQLRTISDLVAIAHDEYDGCPSYRDDLDCFDRLLAEIKAEAQSAPSNAAALREALEAAQALLLNIDFDADGGLDDDAAPVMADIGHALAAPARNCDRFHDEDEAVRAYLDEVCSLADNGAPTNEIACNMKMIRWLFAPSSPQDKQKSCPS